MKIHTTNYFNTFIEVADDCNATTGEVPPNKKSDKSIANIQFEMIYNNPYKYTSDEVLFHCFAIKNAIDESQFEETKVSFFSKGQPCLRTSPLTKRYGWGIHYNTEGKVAMFGFETQEYKSFSTDNNLKKLKAMRSKK